MTLARMGEQIAAAFSRLAADATLTRGATVHQCRVVEEDVDRTVAGALRMDERLLLLLDLPAGIEPQARDRIDLGGEVLIVQSAARSGMGSTWHAVAKR